MDRREAVSAVSPFTLAALSAGSAALEDHEHQLHMVSGTARYQAILEAAGACVAKGQACLAHCLVLLGGGDKSLGDCAQAVNQMLAACGALQSLAAQASPLVGSMAKVALDGCKDCQKACRPHAAKHAECKSCMESCAECIKQCEALAT